MKIDGAKTQAWITEVSTALPGFQVALAQANSEVLLIGAVVLEFYSLQGWMPSLKRSTGDIDLSVSLLNGPDDYNRLKQAFLDLKYFNKPHEDAPQFRFFPPRTLPGAIAYIDLLAHPYGNISEATARQVMGAGPNFSFEGIAFAQTHAFRLMQFVLCPNPIAMVGLKLNSYRDEPAKRIKDLADVAELASGLVEFGSHFEMTDEWEAMKSDKNAQTIKRTLSYLGEGKSIEWDLENARHELLRREFNVNDIEELIPQRILEWVENLE